MAEVLDALGGTRTVRAAPHNTREWMDSIMAGLPSKAALAFKIAMGLSNDQLSALLGISLRSLSRLDPKRSILDPVVGDRLYRSARLYTLAVNAFEDPQAASRWMKAPQRALGNAVPLDLAKTDIGAREVETLLGRLEHGVYS
jgi:putative toxin-antitoxin system antitoxin component (TIGR02293 family)